jgi:hypothetical protein
MGNCLLDLFSAGIGEEPSSAQIADAFFSVWSCVDEHLSSVIGKQGLAALHERSVVMSALRYPWLFVHPAETKPALKSDMHSVMSRQLAGETMAACREVLRMFYDILSRLIGASLAEQLLTSCCPPP